MTFQSESPGKVDLTELLVEEEVICCCDGNRSIILFIISQRFFKTLFQGNQFSI